MSSIPAYVPQLFTHVTNFLQEQYLKEDPKAQYDRVANATMRMLRMLYSGSRISVEGDGITVQVLKAPMDAARGANSMYAALHTPASPIADKVKFRFDPNNASLNDFHRIDATIRIGEFDLKNKSGGAAESLVDLMEREFPLDMEEKSARANWTLSTGQLGAVSSTPKQGNGLSYTGATSTITANSQGAWFNFTGPRGMFQRGNRISFWRSGVRIAENIRIVRVNEQEGTMRVEYPTTGDYPASGSLLTTGGIASADLILPSDTTPGGGMKSSILEWCTAPTATESWIGAKDRFSASDEWLCVPHGRQAETSAVIDPDMITDALTNFSTNHTDESSPMKILSSTAILNTLRKRFGPDTFIMLPPGGSGERNYVMGSNAVFFEHPTIGRVEVLAEKFCPSTFLGLFHVEDWREMSWNELNGYGAFEKLVGNPALGGWWKRDESPVPGAAGGGLTYSAGGYRIIGTFCHRPDRSLVLDNVTA